MAITHNKPCETTKDNLGLSKIFRYYIVHCGEANLQK
jgi:hypothetical protein